MNDKFMKDLGKLLKKVSAKERQHWLNNHIDSHPDHDIDRVRQHYTKRFGSDKHFDKHVKDYFEKYGG